MPVWHESLRELVKAERIAIVGVIQEQHPERCRLFAQWKKFDWPIVYDPINQLGLRAVPMLIAVDEHGVVQSTRPTVTWVRETFVDAKYPAPTANPPPSVLVPRLDSATGTGAAAGGSQTSSNDKRVLLADHLASLRRQAKSENSPLAWRTLGDNYLLWQGASGAGPAIAAYQAAARLDPQDATIQFRLGVAYRRRFESSNRGRRDFRSAVEHWTTALEQDPNHYIYRRRIQQYGPRLSKPYPFYDWVEQAQREIAARGDKPIALSVPPQGAEIARPTRRWPGSGTGKSPDPKGRILRDKKDRVAARAVIVPARVRPGTAARVHVELTPNGTVHWNNEAEPVQVWLEPPSGWDLDRRLIALKQPLMAESTEARRFEFELRAPRQLDPSQAPAKITGYILYYVCDEAEGTCFYLRQDLEIAVATAAPRR